MTYYIEEIEHDPEIYEPLSGTECAGHLYVDKGADFITVTLGNEKTDIYLDEPFTGEGDWENQLSAILDVNGIDRSDAAYIDCGFAIVAYL
ncbi:hypothetical protein CRD18_10775 (plasmid) [Corynebacterium sp. LK31]|uniref:hypothetical protein n=1 Tax=Corynebacterium sp. LK31 TaxID=2044576 RepID=UPI0016525977|nr:hypothetical protein [Corynebacterium sp. LK31]MBC6798072.1 hypothetical protein [Corynebacterium sp. LK31]